MELDDDIGRIMDTIRAEANEHAMQKRQPISSPALILGSPRAASRVCAGNEEGFGSVLSGIG
jgi:hypothetical protein